MAESFDVTFKASATPPSENGRVDFTITTNVVHVKPGKDNPKFFKNIVTYGDVPPEQMMGLDKIGHALAEASGVKIAKKPDGFTATGITRAEMMILQQAGMALLQHLVGMGIAAAAIKNAKQPPAR